MAAQSGFETMTAIKKLEISSNCNTHGQELKSRKSKQQYSAAVDNDHLLVR